jgi:hypothetical protein
MTEWTKMTKDTTLILREAAKTFAERGGVYRDNHQRVGAVMLALFPEGINVLSADDHEKISLINLIVIKLTRYAVEIENGGHKDSAHDLIVYAAMLEARTPK